MNKSWIILFSFLVSCMQPGGQNSSKEDIGPASKKSYTFLSGVVQKDISCKVDSTYSYALYLPSTYADSSKLNYSFPVIFFFDAHRRGVLPVKKYAPLAEKFGFILVGSNNSMNGQTQGESDRIVSVLFDEVRQRYRVDDKRLVVSGFSGGARVAAGIALFRKEPVAGVIGCAAGFPPISLGYNTQFNYLAIVGNKDFNYLELKELDRTLNQMPISHCLLVYDGKHDWPLKQVMQEGFQYMLFDAMRKDLLLKDKKLIEEFQKRNDSLLVTVSGNVVQEVAVYRKMVSFLYDLIPVERYRNKLDKLTQTKTYIKWQQEEERQELFERNQQQKYAAAIGSKNLSWWLQEIEDLYKKPEDPVSLRLQNYLSLVSYMYASGTLKNNQFKEAEKYLTIYKKVDPDNPEVYYLKAVLLTRTGKAELALAQLQVAADKGFNEYERMQNSKDFNGFQDNEVFERILLQIRDKSEQ